MTPPHWSSLEEVTLVRGILLLYWIHRLFGRWPFRACAYPVVVLHWLCRPLVRRSSREYLERLESATGAIGHAVTWRDSLRHVCLFADTMLDKLLAVAGKYPLERVRTEGREAFYEYARSGNGGVIVTAHMGCLELCRAMADRTGLVKLTILVHTRHAQRFNRLLLRLDPGAHFSLLEVAEFGPATAVQLHERVARGEFVVVAGDRAPISAVSPSLELPFLGRAARFPAGPYLIAGVLRCPLFLMVSLHEGDGYLIHFEPLAERVTLPRGAREAAIAQHAQRYVERITALLQRSPFDWFNYYPFWDQDHGRHAQG